MKSRHLSLVPPRFPRTMDEAFKTARYADPIHRPPRKSGIGRFLLISALAVVALVLIAGRA